MRSADEARAYLSKLRSILLAMGVSDCKMEEGSMRCEANISVMPRGSKEFGTLVELRISPRSGLCTGPYSMRPQGR